VLSVATHLAPSVQPLYAFLADYLGDRLGRPARLEVAESYERCARDIDDVCFVCSVPYLLFAASGRIEMEVLAAPVLAGERYGGRPIYFSDVVVARDGPYRSLADLRGRRWAYNEPFSHSGYVTVWYELVQRGEGVGYFGEVVEAGFHDVALRMVADGRVDGAAIDSQVLAIELRDHPELADRIRVVEAIGPSTIQPVVASVTRLSAGERRLILQALVDVATEPGARPLLAAACVEAFAPVEDATYDDIRMMLAAVEDAAVLDGTWRARWEAVTAATAASA
jgi:phosphonate transport system substrate-binding protein